MKTTREYVKFYTIPEWNRTYIGVRIIIKDIIHTNFCVNVNCYHELKIDKEDFLNMLKSFNVKYNSTGQLYFDNKKDANEAVEWFNSILLVKTLQGE